MELNTTNQIIPFIKQKHANIAERLPFFNSCALQLGVSNPTRNPTNPSNPPEPKPVTARTDHSDGRWRVSAPKTRRRRVEWRVFFSKTRATRPDRRYIQIWQYARRSKQDLVRSGNIQVRFGEIRRHLRRSKRNLVRSDDIRGDPSEISTIFGEIRRDSRRSGLISAIFGADLLGFCRFRRIFWRFRRRLQDPATLSTDRTDPNTTRTQNRLDRVTPAVGFGSLRLPPDARRVGSGLGPKPTRPTRGQPYLLVITGQIRWGKLWPCPFTHHGLIINECIFPSSF